MYALCYSELGRCCTAGEAEIALPTAARSMTALAEIVQSRRKKRSDKLTLLAWLQYNVALTNIWLLWTCFVLRVYNRLNVDFAWSFCAHNSDITRNENSTATRAHSLAINYAIHKYNVLINYMFKWFTKLDTAFRGLKLNEHDHIVQEGNSVCSGRKTFAEHTRRFLVRNRLKNQRPERERRLSNVIRKVSRLAGAF